MYRNIPPGPRLHVALRGGVSFLQTRIAVRREEDLLATQLFSVLYLHLRAWGMVIIAGQAWCYVVRPPHSASPLHHRSSVINISWALTATGETANCPAGIRGSSHDRAPLAPLASPSRWRERITYIISNTRTPPLHLDSNCRESRGEDLGAFDSHLRHKLTALFRPGSFLG